MIWCELLFQVPFFVAAIHAFVAGRDYIRTPAIVYGVHTWCVMRAIRASSLRGAIGIRLRVSHSDHRAESAL